MAVGDVEGEDSPLGEVLPVIEDACAVCHLPMARTQALADGTEVAMFDGGFVDADNPLHEAGMDGVSCTVCHQIQEDGLGAEESFSGEFVIPQMKQRLS